MEVVNHDDERLALGYAPEKSRDRIEEPKPRLLRVDPLQTRSFSLNWCGPNKLGHQRCHLLNPGAKCLGQLRKVRTFGALPNDLYYRPIGWHSTAFPASSPDNPQAPASSPGRNFVGQARFSNARLPRNHEHPPVAGNGLVQRAAELSEFTLASNEPFAGYIMLAFRRPQDAYRRSSDFFLSQIAAP